MAYLFEKSLPPSSCDGEPAPIRADPSAPPLPIVPGSPNGDLVGAPAGSMGE